MGKSDSLGQFEQLVLAAVQTVDNAYGPPIHAKVEQLAAKRVRFASVYTTLNRLEQKGYISSREAARTHPRGHQPKRCYTVTATGEMALQDSVVMAQRFLELLRVNSNPQHTKNRR